MNEIVKWIASLPWWVWPAAVFIGWFFIAGIIGGLSEPEDDSNNSFHPFP